MNSDSDGDLQAYLNQLTRKAYDLQHEDEAITSSVSIPTHLSSSLEVEKSRKLPQKIDSQKLKRQDSKSNKIKLLEEKYLKIPAKKKESKRIPSISWSKEDFGSFGELEGDSSGQEEAGTPPEQYDDHLYESQDYDSNYSDGTGMELKNVTMNENNNPSSRDGTKKLVRKVSNERRNDSVTEVDIPLLEENRKNHFSGTTQRRKSSTASLLMTKDGVFYSSSISTDVNKPKPCLQRKKSTGVIKFAKYDLNAEDSVVTDSAPTQVTESVEEEVLDSEAISHIERRRSSSLKASPEQGSVVEQTPRRSSHKSRVRKEILYLKKKHQSPSPIPTDESVSERKPMKFDRKRDDDSYERKTSHRQRIEVKPLEKEKRGKTAKEANRSEDLYSSSTSLSSSSSSCSFSVKMKKKNYMTRKRRLKKEKELTELIIKVLVKNLPFLMRDSISHHQHSSLQTCHEVPNYEFICNTCRCTSDAVSWKIMNNRIDDAMRQTINLTRQFLDSHQKFLSTHTKENSTFSYTSLKKY